MKRKFIGMMLKRTLIVAVDEEASPRPQKTNISVSKIKVMLVAFLD